MNSHTHVLLIEDNPGDADLIRLRLVEANSDLAVTCVNRLSDGLASLAKEPPSVVLLDLNLPDSKGAETFRNILSKAPGVPVVVLSGQDDEELAVRAVHQGVQDYLVKGDFDSKQLARAMGYAIERQALLTSLDLSRQQQLQFKDEFLSHVSHELRTPLTCIHQFVMLFLDGLAGPILPEQREHLGTILRSVDQLRNMIGNLLEATRAETKKIRIEPRCLAIGDVLQQTVSMLQATAREKRVGLEIVVDARIPLVYADPDRILQVLINLADNAIKFTPPDGSVTLKAYLVDADPEFVYVSVTDTGRGISPKAKALIFERLFQDPNANDNSRKGLGLGLYIAKELVRLHAGRMWVESQLGHGSVFSFTLPVSSLSKLLLPVITDHGELRDALTLVMIELTPLLTPSPGHWEETRQRCREVLRQCVIPGKDMVLPSLGKAGRSETFVIVVSADQRGAKILLKRVREQLEGCAELNANGVFKASTLPIEMPSREGNEPVEELARKVADGIAKTVITLLPRQSSDESNQTTPV
jgi:signal transduction histidine kinase